VRTTEELLGRKSSGSGPEIREYGRRDLPLTTRHPPTTSPTSGGRSLGIVPLQTKATEFLLLTTTTTTITYASFFPLLLHITVLVHMYNYSYTNIFNYIRSTLITNIFTEPVNLCEYFT
jgi:hypothetical protein